MIKELRQKTGAGIMICKKVLSETGGDMNRALETLKEMEAAIAAKKAERVTAEGLIGAYVLEDKKAGAICEINCETDFVASNRDFIALTHALARQITAAPLVDIESLMQERYIDDADSSVKDTITSLIAKFAENISLSRLARFSTETGIIQSYVHNHGKIGVLVELSCEGNDLALEQAAKEVAMQVTATNPPFLNRETANQDTIDLEVQAYKNQALSEGKPEHVVGKIVAGKINKFYKNNCLLEQPWIKNEDMTIAMLLHEYSNTLGARIDIVRFLRFELGKS